MNQPVKLLSRVQLFGTPWTVAFQDPQSMEFSRQEYWSGLPFPSPGDLPDPGTEPRFPTLQAVALPSESPGKPNLRPLLTQMNMCYCVLGTIPNTSHVQSYSLFSVYEADGINRSVLHMGKLRPSRVHHFPSAT